MSISARTDDVLTHRKQQESKSDCGNDWGKIVRGLSDEQQVDVGEPTSCADGEKHLHGVEEEEHDEE